LFEFFARLRLIRHDLILLKHTFLGVVGTGLDRIVFLIGAVLISSVAINNFSRALMVTSDLPAGFLCIVGGVVGAALFLFCYNRLKYFNAESNLAEDTFGVYCKYAYIFAIALAFTILASPLLFLIIKLVTLSNIFFEIMIYFLFIPFGYYFCNLIKNIYVFSLNKYESRSRDSRIFIPRTGTSEENFYRLSKLMLIQKVPFAKSAGGAVAGLFLMGFIGVVILNISITGMDHRAIFLFPVLYLFITNLILTRVDYSMIRFTSAFGNSLAKDIFSHLMSITVYFGILLILVLILAIDFQVLYFFGIFIIFLGIGAVATVRICYYRTTSRSKADFFLQLDVASAAIIALALPPAAVVFLIIRWGIVLRRANASTWLLD
jgi:hypothetical protein